MEERGSKNALIHQLNKVASLNLKNRSLIIFSRHKFFFLESLWHEYGLIIRVDIQKLSHWNKGDSF